MIANNNSLLIAKYAILNHYYVNKFIYKEVKKSEFFLVRTKHVHAIQEQPVHGQEIRVGN